MDNEIDWTMIDWRMNIIDNDKNDRVGGFNLGLPGVRC
jgi:hypothetical protein